MGGGWCKFAIRGRTYARALENAAQRAGRSVEGLQPALSQIAAQPQAKLKPGLSSFMREPGTLPMTPQIAATQDLAHALPWAGQDHTTGTLGLARANRVLDQRGLSTTTPGGPAAFHQQKVTNLPLAPKTHDSTQVGPAPGWQPRDPQRDYWRHRGGMDRVLDKFDQYRRQGDPAGARRAPLAQPAAINRPDVTIPARASPIGGSAAGPNEGTAVLKTGAALPFVAGAAIPLAVSGAILARKPGIHADIANSLHNPGDIHQQDAEQAIPAEVLAQAARAHEALTARGIDPSALRMAVDAPSGAGKTVLSKALAQQMGLRHHGLDWRPHMRAHQLMGGGDIEKTPYAPHAGEILEHQQLLRSYDPSLFDAAIHINKDPATIRQQVLQRGRSARTHDLLDYEKSIDVGNRAFDTLGGEAIDLGGGTVMKIRPREGWGDALDQQLAAAGIDATGLTRHQKLLSLHSGKREAHGAGWTPYVKNPFSGGEMAAIGASVPLGVMAARALTKTPIR